MLGLMVEADTMAALKGLLDRHMDMQGMEIELNGRQIGIGLGIMFSTGIVCQRACSYAVLFYVLSYIIGALTL